MSKSRHKHTSASNQCQQVRIIGGQFKRRKLSFIAADGLRPTPDRLRETLFNWLMHDLPHARVLDCCAGSGVLGFEALSRGARQCVFIEANRQQAQQLRLSADMLKLTAEQAIVHHTTAQAIIPQLSGHFDVVFIDPPYGLDLWQPILDLLIQHQRISPQGLVYLESNRPLDDSLHTLASAHALKLTCHKHTQMGQINAQLLQIQATTC